MSGRLLVVGHSVAEGGGASEPAQRYTSVLARLLELEERNLAVGGAITCWPQGGRSPGDGGWEHVVSRVAPDPTVRACVAHFGLNDLPVLGPGGLAPFQEALRTVITRLRAGRVGIPPRLRRPLRFAGETVSLVFRVERSDAGAVAARLDGEDHGFELPGEGMCDPFTGYANGVTLTIRGLEPGDHSLSVSGPGRLVAWSQPAAAPPPVIVPLGHRVLDWGWYDGWPHACEDADVPVLNDAIREVVESFGSQDVVAFDFDPVLDKDPTLFAGDRFYPNDEGHRRIAAGLAQALEPLVAG